MQKKVEETDVVMAEVETVSRQYLPLSTACSSIYFTLESLNQVRGGRGGMKAKRGFFWGGGGERRKLWEEENES